MKPFSLKEYLVNPNRKIVTGNGKNVRIICTNAKVSAFHPIITLVEEPNGNECIVPYTNEGHYYSCEPSRVNDLFFAPEKKVGWINIYQGKDGPIVGNIIFASKEEAEESKRHCCGFTQNLYLTTAKIEWEE